MDPIRPGDAWKSECEYIGCTETVHLAKLILAKVCPGLTGLEAYKRYLSHRLSMQQDLFTISQLSDDLLGHFYRTAYPKQPPKYFALWDEANNLSRLEYALDLRLVVLRVNKNRTWTAIHDRSVFDLLSQRTPRRVVFVLRLCEGRSGKKGKARSFDVYLASERPKEAKALQDLTYKGYVEASGLDCRGRCFYQIVGDLLETTLSTDHQHGEDCNTLGGLASSGDRLRRDLPVAFVLVSHVRSPVFPNSTCRDSFAVLCVVGDPSEAKTRVLGVTADGVLYRYKHKSSKPLFEMMRETQRRLPGSEPVVEEEAERRPPQAQGPPEGWGGCRCGPCLDAFQFESNVKTRTVSSLYKIQVPLTDALKALGLWNARVEEQVLEACEASLCAFDIESCATSCETDDDQEDEALQPGLFSNVSKNRRIYAKQEPVLIGFTSLVRARSFEGKRRKRNVREDGGCVILGSWPGHEEDHDEDVVSAFMNEMLRARDRLSATKSALLADLLAWVARLKKAHMDFFLNASSDPDPDADSDAETVSADEDDEDLEDSEDADTDEEELLDQLSRDLSRLDAETLEKLDLLEEPRYQKENLRSRCQARQEFATKSGWRKSLGGRLEKALQDLVRCCFVFGFNAEG